jgi:hypothetical protein
LYYSVEKFRVAYYQLIPAMTNKSQSPEFNHEFFMHPPLLKLVASWPKTKRFAGEDIGAAHGDAEGDTIGGGD